MLLLVISFVFYSAANQHDCQHHYIDFPGGYGVSQVSDGTDINYIYLAPHPDRMLSALFNGNFTQKEWDTLFSEKKIIGYLNASDGPGLDKMRARLPNLIDFLENNKEKIKFWGQEVSLKNSSQMKKNFLRAKKLKAIFEEKIPKSKFKNRDQKIKNFILSTYGIETYLNTYRPKLVKDFKQEPLESDIVLGRNAKELPSLRAQFKSKLRETCSSLGQESKALCMTYRRLLKRLEAGRELGEPYVHRVLSRFSESKSKTMVRDGLGTAQKFYKMQRERDAAVARRMAELKGSVFTIYGKSHKSIAPNVSGICYDLNRKRGLGVGKSKLKGPTSK